MAIQKLFTSLSKAGNTNAYVGEKGRIWYDPVKGFRISDGVTPGGQAAAVAVTNANIGDLVITGATISTANTNEDLNLDTNGTGNVNILGAFNALTTSGRTIIETLQNGTLNFYVPNISFDSAIDIIGSADGAIVVPQNTGVLLHLTGQDSLPARIYNDSVNNYAAFIGRRYNGTADAPTQVLSGNIIARYGATPYSNTGWPSISTARMDFVALEDQTATTLGTSVQFYTTPLGSDASVPSMTIASTGISNAANVVPISDQAYNLGTATLRWKNVYAGQGGLWLADSVTNAEVQLGVNNGTLYINGVQNLAVGNLVILNTTLTSITPSTDIQIGNTGDSGILDIGRTVRIRTQNLNTQSALLINGTLTNTVPTEYTNTLFHTVAVPGYNGIHLNDAFGTGVFPTYEGRSARGNVASPSATQSGDVLLRVAGAGYGTNTFDTALGTQGGSRIDFRATENYTNTAKGSDIHFWTTQPGTTSTVNSGSIDWQGFTGNAFTFTTDNSVQTTAGIPLTQKGSGLGVATLDSNGYLTAAQIPPSLTGGVVYKGAWDASTNTPNLANGSGTAGWEYSISTAGTQNLGAGNQAYAQGGFVIYNGSVWSYVPPTGLFTSLTASTHLSVNQPTGAITISVDATSANTASTIVSRDASGNFNANTITATLNGTATSAGTAGTVTNAIQSVITQVGTLTSLGVTGNVTAGNVSAGTGTISAATGQFTNINNSLQTITANVGAFETYANATFATASTVQTLSANVGAFETFSNANTAGLYNSILGANAAIVTANTGLKSYVDGQVSTLNTTITTANTNVVSYVNSQITTVNNTMQTLSANVGAYELFANANVAGLQNQITGANAAIVTANSAVVSYVNTLNSAMAANVAGANAAIVTANTAMKGYVDAVSTAWTANAGTQQTQINSINSNVTAANAAIATLQTQVYTNANVASYLPTYSGNIAAGNVAIALNETVGGTVTVTGNVKVGGNLILSNTAGGVTQSTNKTTAVTANGATGQITMASGTIGAYTINAFTVNNSYVNSNDSIIVNLQTPVTAATYLVTVGAVAAGSFIIYVYNATGAGHNDALVINFAVVKSIS